MEALHTIAIISLVTCGICALIILIDILSGNRQQMMIMNFVYPITALYSGPLGLLVYFTLGRKTTSKIMSHGHHHMQKPMWQSVVTAALHCGSGCTLGDVLSEPLLLLVPIFLFGSKLYGGWAVDFVFAFVIGIIFQYYSIKPMKNLAPADALKAALKADTLSLTFWQIGMYGWMAVCVFLIFGRELKATEPVFWFMMQIAMLCGFITAYPVNWWLLKKGIKEAM